MCTYVCCCSVKVPQGVFQHMLGEFVHGDFVVWSLGIADFGNEGTRETDRAKVKIAKTSANQQLDQTKKIDFEIWRYPEITCTTHVF